MRNAVSSLAICLLTAAFAHTQEQRPALRAAISCVLIDVTVLDKDGRPVTEGAARTRSRSRNTRDDRRGVGTGLDDDRRT